MTPDLDGGAAHAISVALEDLPLLLREVAGDLVAQGSPDEHVGLPKSNIGVVAG